mmetsp:Transcript_34486/g.111034  ORF Transcript_34486/g.111034 Transcript_34486/m.111034 type:complete len:265 (-) Transcript_34486:259-1053(-)
MIEVSTSTTSRGCRDAAARASQSHSSAATSSCSISVRLASPSKYPSSRFPGTHGTSCCSGAGASRVTPKSIIHAPARHVSSATRRRVVPISSCREKTAERVSAPRSSRTRASRAAAACRGWLPPSHSPRRGKKLRSAAITSARARVWKRRESNAVRWARGVSSASIRKPSALVDESESRSAIQRALVIDRLARSASVRTLEPSRSSIRSIRSKRSARGFALCASLSAKVRSPIFKSAMCRPRSENACSRSSILKNQAPSRSTSP